MPKTGGFYCYKKTYLMTSDEGLYGRAVVKLYVYADALRFQARGTKKFRVSRAKVISIKKIDFSKRGTKERLVNFEDNLKAVSMHSVTLGSKFIYTKGKQVAPIEDFDLSKTVCASGIHAFMCVEDAINYRY